MKHSITAILSWASILLTLLIPSTLSAYYSNLDSTLLELKRQTRELKEQARELEHINNRMKACSYSNNAYWDILSETCNCNDGYFPLSQSGASLYSLDVCVEKEKVFSAKITKLGSIVNPSYISMEVDEQTLGGNIAPINQTGSLVSGCQNIFMKEEKTYNLFFYHSKFFLSYPLDGYCEIQNVFSWNDYIPSIQSETKQAILKTLRGAKNTAERIDRLNKLREKYIQERELLSKDTVALDIVKMAGKITFVEREIERLEKLNKTKK